LCQQYWIEAIYSHVAIKFNKSISLPNAILCIAIDSSIPTKLKLLTEINESTADPLAYSNELEFYFNNQTFDKMTFLSRDHLWSPIMLYIASQYITVIQIAEGNIFFSDSTIAFNQSQEIYIIQCLLDNYFEDNSSKSSKKYYTDQYFDQVTTLLLCEAKILLFEMFT
jgi:hypothetical protein